MTWVVSFLTGFEKQDMASLKMLMSFLQPKRQETTSWGTLSYYGAVSLVSYGLLQFVRRYLRWWYTPLRQLPGPCHGNFWVGTCKRSPL